MVECEDCGSDTVDLAVVMADYGDGAFVAVLCDRCDVARYRAALAKTVVVISSTYGQQ